jgi:hypothetical protein
MAITGNTLTARQPTRRSTAALTMPTLRHAGFSGWTCMVAGSPPLSRWRAAGARSARRAGMAPRADGIRAAAPGGSQVPRLRSTWAHVAPQFLGRGPLRPVSAIAQMRHCPSCSRKLRMLVPQ